MLQALFTVALLTTAFTLTMAAQENSGGTINTLSLDPRQNAELTNSTGTASGQPSDAVDGSQGQENGLVPVTTNMQGSGSNGNMNPPPAAASTASETAATNSATPEASKAAKPGASSSASKTTANPSKTTSNPKK
jgi:hypothetical protein